jgi:hypothetical protein
MGGMNVCLCVIRMKGGGDKWFFIIVQIFSARCLSSFFFK